MNLFPHSPEHLLSMTVEQLRVTLHYSLLEKWYCVWHLEIPPLQPVAAVVTSPPVCSPLAAHHQNHFLAGKDTKVLSGRQIIMSFALKIHYSLACKNAPYVTLHHAEAQS